MSILLRESQTPASRASISASSAKLQTLQSILSCIFRFSKHSQRASAQQRTQGTVPIVSMLLDLRDQTEAYVGPNVTDIVLSYSTFFEASHKVLISIVLAGAGLVDAGCHPDSNSAVTAYTACEHTCVMSDHGTPGVQIVLVRRPQRRVKKCRRRDVDVRIKSKS